MKLIVALLVFGIIVIFHEFGHFIVAKKNGIVVEEFAVGMGPKLFGVRRGETEYTLRLLKLELSEINCYQKVINTYSLID